MRGCAPFMRRSISSSVSRPPPPPQQKVCLADRLRRHVEIVVADRPQDGARNVELAARLSRPCARRARRCSYRGRSARKLSFFDLSKPQLALLDQVVGEFADVLRHRIVRVEEVERTGERVRGNCRRRARHGRIRRRRVRLTFEVPRRLADAQRDIFCMFSYEPMNMPKLAASEACELKRPGDARFVQHLGVADQALHVRRGEEVGATASPAGCRRLPRRAAAHGARRFLPRCPPPGPPACCFSALGGRPRLLPILKTLPMISLQYFWPMPMVSMISRAAMEISAVSMPKGQ